MSTVERIVEQPVVKRDEAALPTLQDCLNLDDFEVCLSPFTSVPARLNTGAASIESCGSFAETEGMG